MTKIQFHPLDITYKVEDEKPVIYIFGRTTGGEQICVIDKNFLPYFWVMAEDNKTFAEKVRKLEVEIKQGVAKVLDAEVVKKKYLGRDVDAVKVTVNMPPAVPALREVIKKWDFVKSVNEADILFVRRYLIDKGITPLTVVEAEGELTNIRSKVPVFKASSVSQFSDDSIKESKIVAVDIETYNPAGKGDLVPEKNPIIMLAVYAKDFQKVITWKRFKTDKDYIEFVKSEEELITRFLEVIEEVKPDIITGYYSDGFDFPYIKVRADKYKIKLDIGLDYSGLRLGKGQQQTVEITGIVHLDIFRFIRKIMRWSLDTDVYTLDAVSAELLGEKKHEVDLDSLAHTWDKTPEELEKFCEYNLKDAELTLRLCEKLMPNIEELVKIIGIPLFSVSRMSFSQLVEWYILKQIPQFNEIAPNRPSGEEVFKRREQTYKGGFVFEPKPGVYKNIVVFDFRSLYPTIITSHNVGLSTLNCSCCEDKEHAPTEKKEYWFCKKTKGFIPVLIEDIVTRRMRIKEIIKKESNKLLEARSESLKLLANSFYGYLGFAHARWYSLECARSTTAYGRHYIQQVIEKARKEDFTVLYSDTDSIFITLKDKTKQDAMEFVENVNDNLPGLMELEYEGFYPSGIFVSAKEGQYGAKKKYALLTEEGLLKIKGFETVRRNWSFIAKEVQENILNTILKEGDKEKAFKYVRQILTDLREKKIPKEKVIIFTQLTREIKDYTSVGPHVAVAQRMRNKGMDVGPGSLIQFIVTTGKGVIRERARMPDETEDYDADYYIKNQVVPAVETIFRVLGYSKEDLLQSKDQEKLSKFFTA